MEDEEDYGFVEEFVDSDANMSEEDKEEFMENFYTCIRNVDVDEDDDE